MRNRLPRRLLLLALVLTFGGPVAAEAVSPGPLERCAIPEHLTRMDLLVLSTTVLVFLALGEVVVTSHLAQRDRAELARRIDYHARWVYLSLFGIVLLVTMVW